MRTMVVDDEPIMLRSFIRQSSGIEGIDIVGKFSSPQKALDYAKENPVELAVLDISMPQMTGIALAQALREINPGILIVFLTAYDEYLREANRLGADDYILKPYTKENIRMMMEKMRLLVKRQKKRIYFRMFGNFVVLRDGKPLHITGKAKEILALVATRRGQEITNEEIYSTMWEDREYDNIQMKVYYNAIKRLRDFLQEENLSDLLISTARGQMVNTELFDCDYYEWLDKDAAARKDFDGRLLSEYSWGEYILAEMAYESERP